MYLCGSRQGCSGCCGRKQLDGSVAPGMRSRGTLPNTDDSTPSSYIREEFRGMMKGVNKRRKGANEEGKD